MGEIGNYKFFKLIVSSNIRSSILFSLMEGSRSSADLFSVVDGNSRNLLKALKELTDMDLICKNGKKYSLTNSGRLVMLNISDFMDGSS